MSSDAVAIILLCGGGFVSGLGFGIALAHDKLRQHFNERANQLVLECQHASDEVHRLKAMLRRRIRIMTSDHVGVVGPNDCMVFGKEKVLDGQCPLCHDERDGRGSE